MAKLKCDSCMVSREIVSENGYHSICCLPYEIMKECLISGKYYVGNLMYQNTPEDKEEVKE